MNKIIIYISAILITFSSCDDYLNRMPLNNPSDETFLSNETEMKMALTACYSDLWLNFSVMPFMLTFDYLTDIGYERDVSALQALGQGAGDATNKVIVDYWKGFYNGISKCNNLIQNMERGRANVNAATYAQIKAEARFLRALYYSYLIELYGDVPLVTEVLSLNNSKMARTPKSAVVDFILKELTEASGDMVETNNPVSGHASKGAALAIKARVALYNERWADAISASSAVMAMEGTQYALESNYSKLFRNEGEASKEVIFSVQYMVGTQVHTLYRLFGSRNASAFTNKKPAYQLADSWECVDGLPIDKSPLFNPKDPFKNRDPRLGYTLAVPGSEFLGFQFETHGDSIQCWNYLTNKRVNNLEATHAYATFTGLCWRKYANVDDRLASNQCDMNPIIIRYAEVLLTYAEAKIKAGQIDASVYEAINKVRKRPSVNMPPVTTADPTELFYAVCRERKYEFAGEGLRLFDIRRWKIAEVVMNEPLLGRMKKAYPDKAPRIDKFANAYYEGIPIASQGESADFKMRVVDRRIFNEERDYLWPIPYIERQTNPELVQNPNYE
ncbi:MAG: RagB/SusD family nutrient uptake outer membrane protein [Macellibacteroides fermentans]|uniref:RagB/SusD family nutrient uptake outer membrane protein n=1 Tax=Macellibacteroides fermentans TaxID=879969 RepID=UPI003ACC249C